MGKQSMLNMKKPALIAASVSSVAGALAVNKFFYCFEGLGGNMMEDGVDAVFLVPKAFVVAPFGFSASPFALMVSVCVFALIWLLFLADATRRKNFLYGIEHGSARWGTKENARNFADLENEDNNIILSQTERLMLVPTPALKPEYDRNRNCLVVGGSGSGKTFWWLKPNLMQLNSSYVLTDPKGLLPGETGHLFEDHGYKIKLFNTIDFKKSMHYNPLAYIKSEKDILNFVTVLMKNTEGEGEHKGEDFWIKAERMFYQAIIGYLFYFAEPEARNMRRLIQLVDLAEASEEDEKYESALDCMFKKIETGKTYDIAKHEWVQVQKPQPDNFAVLCYHSYKQAAGKTAKSILVSCAARLAPFKIKELTDMMEYDEMELDKIGDEKTILYACMSDTNTTFSFLTAMLFYQMFSLLCERADNEGYVVYDEDGAEVYDTVVDEETGFETKMLRREIGRLRYPVQCFFDEFYNIGRIPDWEHTISVIRSRGISATMILQSLSQLKTSYEKEAGTLIDCCDTFIHLGGKSTDTNKEVAEMIGKTTIDNRSVTINRGSQGSYSLAEQIVARDLIDPAEIGKMGKMECLVLVTGCDPYRSKKYATKEHKRYCYIDPHPTKHPDGKYESKFDAEGYVRKHAKLREAEMERERAIQAERRRLVSRAVKRAEAKRLTRMVNDGVGETYLVG